MKLKHLEKEITNDSEYVRYSKSLKGVFYGFTLHHGKAHFVRSIMEAIAFAVQRNIDVLEDLGIKVDEIRSLGGGSRSLLWSQIKADVTQRSVYIMENEEAACLGAAMLAGVATGIYPNLKAATKKMVSIKKQVKPNKANIDTYKQGYKRYTSLYNSLLDMFKKY